MFLVQLNPWTGWLCLCVQKTGLEKGKGVCREDRDHLLWQQDRRRWAFSRCGTAQVHRACPVSTSLQVLVSCSGQGGSLQEGASVQKGWLHPLQLPFLRCILRWLFSSRITRVIAAARWCRATWRGSKWRCEGGAVVGARQSELLHRVLSPKAARSAMAPIPCSVSLYNKQ